MTVEELLRKQCADCGGQVSRAIAGLAPEDADKKPIAHLSTAREAIEHLCEAYHAVKVTSAGEKHEWGSYTSGLENWDHLTDHYTSLREAAIEAAFAGENGEELIADYIIGHDYYHVGQLVTLRLAIDPTWNSYVIYG